MRLSKYVRPLLSGVALENEKIKNLLLKHSFLKVFLRVNIFRWKLGLNQLVHEFTKDELKTFISIENVKLFLTFFYSSYLSDMWIDWSLVYIYIQSISKDLSQSSYVQYTKLENLCGILLLTVNTVFARCFQVVLQDMKGFVLVSSIGFLKTT